MNGDDIRELRRDIGDNRERLVRVETEVKGIRGDVHKVQSSIDRIDKKIGESRVNNAGKKGASKVYNWFIGMSFFALISALITKVVGLW